ncbi:hypothetical protein OHA72_32140 [Dactylosporangium sp. NBC_01737]|nr:hypothetical protein OHA72_32140 [Dactylosporangium sp. NBC_01737]
MPQQAGHAEVDDLRAERRQQHVAGAEVGVHEPDGVDRGERRGDPDGDRLHLPREGAVDGRVVVQGRPGDVLRHQVRHRAVQRHVEHPRGAEAGDPRRGGGLGREALPEMRVAVPDRIDDLERDPAVVGAGGEIDGAHAADAEHAEQPVGPDRGRVLGSQRRGHVPHATYRAL